MELDFLTSIIKATRPKQWVKNLLVAAAPIAAGQFGSQITSILLGVLSFTAASIIGYLINDWRDRESDANHPVKKYRPFAAKNLNFKHLIILLFACLLILISTCLNLTIQFSFTILIYLLITISYSLKIKNEPVVEMIWLSLGFLVRAIAGSAIIQEPPTGWFVVAVGFGALFVVSSKRLAELKNNHSLQTRDVLSKYNEQFLNLVLTTSISITLLTYSLWVFQVHPNSFLAQLTILPFTISIFRYAWYCEKEDAESPESLIYRDKLLIFSSLAIVILLVVVIYK
jgi:decaprenyl-phosphate phosphoribosyltransferase